MRYLLFCKLMLLAFLQVQAQSDPEIIKRIVHVQVSGTHKQEGHGIIIGQAADSIYVITAAHVVPASENISIQIMNNDSLESYPAVLHHKHTEHDLAVLSFVVRNKSFANLCIAPQQEIGAKLRFFKTSRGVWNTGLLRRISVKKKMYIVELRDVEPGDSGSPVFAGNALAGIILSDGMPEVLDISVVKEVISGEWKLNIFQLCGH